MRSPGLSVLHALMCALLFGAISCTGSSSDDDGGASACVEGRIEECPCPDGGDGFQTCDAQGVFGACQCDGADTGTTDTTDDRAVPGGGERR